jgi:hypothetical protein
LLLGSIWSPTNFVLQPWRLLPSILARWLNREQQAVGEHLRKIHAHCSRGARHRPAPERKQQTTWKTSLSAHWDVLAAIDFATIEVWTSRSLVPFYLLFVLELSTRQAHFAGFTPNPGEAWMQQIGTNLTDLFDGFLPDSRYPLMDRDANFCEAFRGMPERKGGGRPCRARKIATSRQPLHSAPGFSFPVIFVAKRRRRPMPEVRSQSGNVFDSCRHSPTLCRS